MPRPSLPPNLKRLETMNVLLTKTTEEEVWAHMTQFFPKYEEKMEEWIEAVFQVKTSINESTFARWNWLKGKPKLYYKKACLHDVWDMSEQDMDDSLLMSSYARDVRKCRRTLKWDTDKEYEEEFGKLWSTLDYLEMRLKGQLESLAETEEYFSFESKRAHERKKIEHETHDEKMLTCVFCVEKARLEKAAEDAVALKKRRDEYEAHAKEQARLEQEALAIEQAKKCAEAKEEERRRQAIPAIHYNCDLCKYHTIYLGCLEEHEESKEHKLKSYFCKLCGVQSRTENEFNFHCSTAKHRTKGGQVVAEQPEKFSCEPCSYVCGSKLLWKQHCAGKKHLQKTDVDKDKER